MKDIETGFPCLDHVLGGGLHMGLFIIGATAGLGKSTFVLQIADYIAAQGTDVLFFSLEMAADELIAKSVSRRMANIALASDSYDIMQAKPYMQILKGTEFAKFSDPERELFFAATTQHAQQAKSFCIRDREKGMTAKKIESAVNEHIAVTGSRPVVFVDYLQRIRPENDKATDKQNIDSQVDILSNLARNNNIPVVLISAVNRDSYEKKAKQSSFKESGKIEYDGDFLAIMQPARITEKDFDYDSAMSKATRELELVILKNRGNQTGGTIEYDFTPRVNLFREKGFKKKND